MTGRPWLLRVATACAIALLAGGMGWLLARQLARPATPPGTPEWITLDLIRLTVKIWQKHYQQELSVQDAVTIIQSAGRLFGVLARELPP